MVAYSMSKAAQVNFARGLAELTKGTAGTAPSFLTANPFSLTYHAFNEQ